MVQRKGVEVSVPALSVNGAVVEQKTAVREEGTGAAVDGEDLRNQLRDFAHTCRSEFAGVRTQLAGLIAVDELEREGDIASIFDEIGGFR